MKKLDFLKIAAIIGIVLLSAACEKEKKFVVEGNVSDAKGKIIYLEHVGVSKVDLLDSIKLKEKGAFRFKSNYSGEPDFYRLRLDGQLINMGIDSTESIEIQADAPNFAHNYTVKGSVDCSKIKKLTLLQLKTSIAYNQLQKRFNNKEISADEYMNQMNAILGEYKINAKNYIYEIPKSTSAYFALFQQINNMLIFDPFDKEDYKAFGAVATSWNQFYPNAVRSKHLYNLALQALKTIRGERPVEYNITESLDHFEINLPNIAGDSVSLSVACKGKLTLVDFTAYQMQAAPVHNAILEEIYNKYKSEGLEIYQISLDSDEHFWKNVASNLSWICVRDPQSVYSKFALSYNVKELPTAFIMNRSGEIVKRVETFDHLGKDIAAYLK